MFFSLAGVLLGGVCFFLFLLLQLPEKLIPPAPPSERGADLKPLTAPPTPFPAGAPAPDEHRLVWTLKETLASLSQTISRQLEEGMARYQENTQQASEARHESLAASLAIQRESVRELTLKTEEIQKRLEMLSARVPEPATKATLPAEEQERWQQALTFGMKFSDWLATVRKKQDHLKDSEAKGFFLRFWESCRAEKVGAFISRGHLITQGEGPEVSPPDLDAELKTLLFGCVSPALVLVYRLNFLLKRRGEAMDNEARVTITELHTTLNACLTVLNNHPLLIKPLHITPQQPCEDKYMNPLDGNILDYFPDFQEQPGRRKMILDILDWAFLEKENLLDGRKAKVIHG